MSERPNRVSGKLVLLAVLLLLAAAFFASGAHRYMSLDELKARYHELLDLYARRPVLVIGGFMLIQITALALSIPGAVLSLALAAGALFGPAWGTVIVLSSITIGDSLGFLVARYLLRDWVEARFGARIAAIDRDIDRNGAFYLLALRLMAIVPYFVVNFAMALTRMRLTTFAPVSFIGLAPATFLYVNAGTALTEIESPGDVLSLRLILILAALGLLPLAARWFFRRRDATEGPHS